MRNTSLQFHYEADPISIEKNSFNTIRQVTDLAPFNRDEQQVVMRIVHSTGLPEVAQHVRFSKHACTSIRQALEKNHAILCDVEMVKQGITKRMIKREPLCFLNASETAEQAREQQQTRSMAALSMWGPYLQGSVVIIGNAPTALFKLLEMIAAGAPKPAAIIGMPVGFIGAAESKQALWDTYNALGVECITLLGNMGGSAVSAAACNALLRCNIGEYY
ncbi:CbiC domain-containing protein [Marinomonas agarivorans]|nr:CbiC domain-containing protein [Marinomonas agarivorans]